MQRFVLTSSVGEYREQCVQPNMFIVLIMEWCVVWMHVHSSRVWHSMAVAMAISQRPPCRNTANPSAFTGDHDATKLSPELYVGPGATMELGELSTGNKIHVTWTWREDKVVTAKVTDFELKGVVRGLPASVTAICCVHLHYLCTQQHMGVLVS